MWIANASRCKKIDLQTTSEFGIPSTVLMERAGLSLLSALKEMLPDMGRISVICGKGNNGGDGLVVARHAQAEGYEVECLIAAKENELSNDSTIQLSVLRAEGIEPIFVDNPKWPKSLECLCCKDLIVDALLGIGVKGEVKGHLSEAILSINCSGTPVLSVDVPSGVNVDTGEEYAISVWATRTVTFGLPKPYLFQGIGIEHAGEWTIADIGWPSSLLNDESEAFLIEGSWVGQMLPERWKDSHKGDYGHTLIIAGSRRYPGAAALAGLAALRAGAGLVTIASIPSVCESIAAQYPELIFLPLPEKDGVIAQEAAEILLENQHHYESSVFGPGLSFVDEFQHLLSKTWGNWNLPSCIDADALNVVSKGVNLPKFPCVLTPHPGEMSRLLHSSTAEVQANRFLTVRSATGKYKQTILLKGAYSLVGEENSALAVNSTGNPGMASAGMGDVLSGIIGYLLAQDMSCYDAACCAMYWHGFAGDICANNIGEIGYRASELADCLPIAREKILNIDCPEFIQK